MLPNARTLCTVLPLNLLLVISTAGGFPVFRSELGPTRQLWVLFHKHLRSSYNIKHQSRKGSFHCRHAWKYISSRVLNKNMPQLSYNFHKGYALHFLSRV
jgi:hypothetical protein